MTSRKYSLKKDGTRQLTPHFKVREFACKDGSDTILIDDSLPGKLEQIRVYAGDAVRITSAYRTADYNRRIGGSANSQHIRGTAADIVTSGRSPADVARFAQAIGCGGVGLYTAQRFVHVDTRSGKSYWKNTGSGDRSVSGHGGRCPYAKPTATLRRGSKGSGVRWLQWWLQLWGYPVSVDGDFGAKTEKAVVAFQSVLDLTADGLAGAKTKNALEGKV